MNIDALADNTLTQYYQHQQQEKKRKEIEQAREDEQAIAVLQALLTAEIKPDLLAALNIEYVVERDRHSRRAEAITHYAGIVWHISQNFAHYSSASWRWHISATREDNGYNYCKSNLTHDADPQMLQTILLLHFGQRRTQLLKEEQEAAQRAEQQLRDEQEAREASERQAREHTEQVEQANQEDAKWRTEMALLKEQAQINLWRWPDGVEIFIYRINYVTAAVSEDSDEDNLHIETESGWTSVDHLDTDGYIRLEAVRNHSWGTICEGREVKLDTPIHRPIWERYRVRAVRQLPNALREEISVSIPHVVCRLDPTLDEISRLLRVEQYDYDESAYTESVGYVPLSWVKALVEQAATKCMESVTD